MYSTPTAQYYGRGRPTVSAALLSPLVRASLLVLRSGREALDEEAAHGGRCPDCPYRVSVLNLRTVHTAASAA